MVNTVRGRAVREELSEEVASELRLKGFKARCACAQHPNPSRYYLAWPCRSPYSEGPGKGRVMVEGRPGFFPLEKNLPKRSVGGSGDTVPATYKQACPLQSRPGNLRSAWTLLKAELPTTRSPKRLNKLRASHGAGPR